MPNKTLGSLVQDILSDMSADMVDDITDTEEAMQVARIVRSEFYAMVDEYDLPGKQSLFQIEATTTTTPTHMTIPERVTYVRQVEYDSRDDVLTEPVKYVKIEYVEPEEFLRRSSGLDGDDSSVDTITDPSGVSLKIINNQHPSFYTSFENDTLVLNSYKSTLDTNLQTSKTRCFGMQDVVLTLDNDSTIDLESQLFSELEARARMVCFVRLKQSRDPTSERTARKLAVRQQRTKYRQDGYQGYPGFGRKSRK